MFHFLLLLFPFNSLLFPLGCFCLDEPEIGDMDERVVERGEDTGNAEDQLTLTGIGAEGDVLLGGTGGLLGRHCWILV